MRGSRICLDLHRPIGCNQIGFRVCLPLDVFQRGYGADERVDVGRLSNRVADAVEPHLGLLAQTANLALEPSASSPSSITVIPRPCC
jgi:hypothetical protein